MESESDKKRVRDEEEREAILVKKIRADLEPEFRERERLLRIEIEKQLELARFESEKQLELPRFESSRKRLELARIESEKQLELAYGTGLIISKGLPPLGPCAMCGGSGSSRGTRTTQLLLNDEPIEPVENSTLSILDEYQPHNLPKLPSSIWRKVSANPTNTLNRWSAEVEIQDHVQAVLCDVIALAGLGNDIHPYREVGVSSIAEHWRPDMVIFRNSKGTTLGVCVVKKPNKRGKSSPLTKTRLYNQIAGYMLHLLYNHGLKSVFGIVTTYNEWRVCWRNGAAELANCTSVDALGVAAEHLRLTRVLEFDNTDKNLFLTDVYNWNQPALIPLLVSTVKKMSVSPAIPPTSLIDIVQEGRRFGRIKIDGQEIAWEPLPHLNPPLKLRFGLPTSCNKVFYQAHDYGYGADGRVWLTVAATGIICVLKISTTSNFEAEADAWLRIWNQPASSCSIIGCNAMFMPFAFHGCVIEGVVKFRGMFVWDWRKSDISDILCEGCGCSFDEESVTRYYTDPHLAAREALTMMATRGYIHEDLKWSHVALMPVAPAALSTLWTVSPILIDLHRISARREDQSIEYVVEAGLAALESSLAEYDY